MMLFRPALIAVLLAAPPVLAQEAATSLPFVAPDPPCILWGPPDRPGGRPVCRRRAEKPSARPISCRLQSAVLDQETGNKMCTYRRPGLGGEETVVSVPASTSCAAVLKC